jgi:hypothetical protein
MFGFVGDGLLQGRGNEHFFGGGGTIPAKHRRIGFHQLDAGPGYAVGPYRSGGPDRCHWGLIQFTDRLKLPV